MDVCIGRGSSGRAEGYGVEILEVYEYLVTKYDTRTGESGLFADCINTFLKIKDEASGYPGWFRSLENEDRYIDISYARERERESADG